MKSSLLAVIAAISMSPSAHAFMSANEQTELLNALNKLNPSQVVFEDIRCSNRSRMCLVKMELGAEKSKVGCAIERITSADDLFVNSAHGIEVSPYTRQALEECIQGFAR